MRRTGLSLAIAAVLAAGCASSPEKRTLAELRSLEPDVAEVPVSEGLEQAMQGYRRFLDETPETELTPEAMRRLADLQIEKQFGIRDGDGKIREMAAPERAAIDAAAGMAQRATPAMAAGGGLAESEQEFELRATAAMEFPSSAPAAPADPSAALEAIALYDRLLAEYPAYEHNDQVLYQKARAYDELGRTEEAMETMQRLIASNAHSVHYDEVQFRRGEYFFTRRRFREAESAYEPIIGLGADSSYYEFALYKLGWTLYKQEFYDEAQHRFMALLDYKVSTGYDFDARHEEDEERRVADTFRVISLGFSNLGGPDVVQEYFAENGRRGYEDRVYANLGEYYLAKLRYDDAAKTYKAFVALNPFHRASPHFSMRVVEIFTEGKFPKLVLVAKKEFAATYGLQAEYWRHFDVNQSPEVLSYLKSNLRDLASHHHALYQNTELVAEKPANYAEALRWYREFLASFPEDPDSPPINYQLADLLLENEAFGEAAGEYERTAYDYPVHDKSAAAGYAAIFAHRQNLKGAPEALQDTARAATVASSLRFADAFPAHEQAPAVLGAAANDLYGMKDFRPAIAAAQKLIERYPGSEPALRRSAFTVVAHSSLELGEYPQAEQAYGQVLALTPQDDKERQTLVDNLAASIYKQGEQANAAQDYRAAADNFLRVKQAAPTSQIRAAAEYDAAAALIRLQEWTAAAAVLEDIPQQLARSRAQSRGDQADCIRVPAERAAVPRRRRIRARRLGVGRPGTTGRGAAGRGRTLRTVRVERAGARRLHALRRAVPTADRHRHRDPLQDRGNAASGARRAALPRGAGADRAHRRGSRCRAHQPHADACGALCAGPFRASLRRVRGLRAATAVRSEPRGEKAAHGRLGGRLRAPDRLRNRRGHRCRDLLPRGDPHGFQPVADGFRAPARAAGR